MYKVIIIDDEPHIIHGLISQIDWEAYSMDVIATAADGQESLIRVFAQDCLSTAPAASLGYDL
ncbi:hypothetical protein [Paenibacillus pinihumi]|uniref:hypothetical protein n=1 Tax=Paenibacillus pinihumi TaxID=669462 RepID=UPI000418AE3F|nr:hypothetical protein [Paenibacillus pinihumi]